MKRRTLTTRFLLTALLSAPPMSAQQPSFRVDVDLVQILATVRDGTGRIVSSLTREDFILEESGRRREIEHFSGQSELPLVLGLLVDTSMSQRRILKEERRASHQFLRDVLRPGEDLAFVVSFDIDVEVLEEVTGSRPGLLRALRDLRVPDLPGRAALGTVLYDAVFASAREILREESGRKAMIVISDGMDFGSSVSLERAIEMAQRSDTIIYTIGYYDRKRQPGARRSPRRTDKVGRSRSTGRPAGRLPRRQRDLPDGKQILQRLASETGGRMFEVSRERSLAEIYRILEDELRHQYLIGFTPDRDGSEDAFRKISLETKDPSLTVSCREGYYLESSR